MMCLRVDFCDEVDEAKPSRILVQHAAATKEQLLTNLGCKPFELLLHDVKADFVH